MYNPILDTFISVADCKSLNKAAEQLYISPTAVMKQMNALESHLSLKLLERTSSHRFRCADDVNQWVMLWWQIASGSFTPFMTDNVVSGVDDGTVDGLCDIIANASHDMICLNDPEGNIDFEALAAKVKNAFETILPEKSSFEK